MAEVSLVFSPSYDPLKKKKLHLKPLNSRLPCIDDRLRLNKAIYKISL